MIRPIAAIVAAAFAAAFALPALAQAELPEVTAEELAQATAAIEAAQLSDTLYQHLWCGAAFSVLEQYLTQQGDAGSATQVAALRNEHYRVAVTEAVAKDIDQQSFVILAAQVQTITISQSSGQSGEADFSQEQCMSSIAAQ